jgi:hypothetical protein
MAHGNGHSSGMRRMRSSDRAGRGSGESAASSIGRMLYKLAPDGSLKDSSLSRRPAGGPKFMKPKGKSY